MGDYHVDYIRHANIFLTNIIPMDERLGYPREMHSTGTLPNELTAENTDASTMRLAGVPQLPNFRPPGLALTDLFANDLVTGTRHAFASADHSLIEIKVIADIMDVLMESPCLRHSGKLPETLASLQQILRLTKLAIRAYQHTPLAQTLSLAIVAEAERCWRLLKELLSNLSHYRHALSAAMLHFIREYIWGSARECGVFTDLNSKLRECHSSFAACILALGRLVATSGIIVKKK